jgi:hypothetical protein
MGADDFWLKADVVEIIGGPGLSEDRIRAILSLIRERGIADVSQAL